MGFDSLSHFGNEHGRSTENSAVPLLEGTTIPEASTPYQLSSESVDIPSMLERASQSIKGRAESFFSNIKNSDLWSNEPGALSLRSYENPARCFERLAGSVRIEKGPDQIENRALGLFFSSPRHTVYRAGNHETRGPAYYVGRDNLLTPLEKLESMEVDMRRALAVINTVQRDSLNKTDYLYYLGALDYLKNHAIALYQVVTHAERKGVLDSDTKYSRAKAFSLALSQFGVRSYFQHALGYGVGDNRGLELYPTLLNETFDYLRSPEFAPKLAEPGRFKLQECDHPAVIGLNAHENARKFVGAEVIVALPLGGLQPGLATQFAFSLLHNREPALITAPLSLHSGQETSTGHISNEALTEILLKYNVAGKSVLVTEDNSNTGNTISAITRALYAAGAREVHVSLAELDITRIKLKQNLQPPFPHIANLDHPDFSTAVRTVAIREDSRVPGKIGAQMVKLYAERVLEWGAANS